MPQTGKTWLSPRRACWALVFILLLVALLRFHLRNIPLERDEGEYAYAGQLMLEGIPPYQLAYNMKLPGTYAAYALILAVFGQSPAGVHLGLLLANALTIFLLYLLARGLAGPLAAVVASASYALLSVSPSVLGFSGHATHFVVLASTGGILLLLEAIRKNRLGWVFTSGVLLGLATVMKQPGIFFVIFAALYLLAAARKQPADWRALGQKLAVFALGAILPFAISCLWLWRAGVFTTFWFWTVSYATEYASTIGLVEGARLLKTVFPKVVGANLGIWLMAGVGLTACFWNREARRHASFLANFFLFSFLAVCPGFLFREHYFILLLPALSLATGVGVAAACDRLSQMGATPRLYYLPIAAFLLALGAALYLEREFFFQAEPAQISRQVFGGNPFPEAIPIAEYLEAHSAPQSKVAILGSEPEIYFYAHRHSATGYIYTYGLMEQQKYARQMQRQMIAEIEAARPEMLLLVSVQTSWLAGPHSDRLILDWADQYVRDQFELTGVADIHSHQTDYRWGEAAKSYRPRSNCTVFVFKRKA